MRSRVLAALLLITIIFQHFEVIQVGSFRVTIAFFTGPIAVLAASRSLSLHRLTAVWAPLVGLTSLAAILASDIADPWDFLSTFLLFLLTSLLVVAGTRGFRTGILTDGVIWKSVHLALIVVVGLSVGQTVLGSLGSDVLFNPFGEFQFQNQYRPYLEFNAFPRAQGFFLEPSYDAFVIGALAIALLSSRKYFRSTMAMAFVGMAVCQSATGLLLFLAIAVLIAVKSRPRIAVPILFLGSTLLFLLGDYLLSRIASIGAEGSSGYYRLVAPLRVLGDVLATHPLGLPLGSIYDVVGEYGLFMVGVGHAVSLDNGIYVIVYYFGWVGVLLVGCLLVWALASAFRSNTRSEQQRFGWIAPVWLLGSLLFSGGIVAPEFGVMTWLVVAAFSELRSQEGQRRAHTDSSKRDHSDVPRLVGA